MSQPFLTNSCASEKLVSSIAQAYTNTSASTIITTPTCSNNVLNAGIKLNIIIAKNNITRLIPSDRVKLYSFDLFLIIPDANTASIDTNTTTVEITAANATPGYSNSPIKEINPNEVKELISYADLAYEEFKESINSASAAVNSLVVGMTQSLASVVSAAKVIQNNK